MNSAETLANLQKFLTLLNPSLNLNEMLTGAARQLVEMFGVDHSGMLRFGPDDQTGEVIAEYPPQGALGLSVPLIDYPLLDRLKTEQKPLAILDAQRDSVMGPARATMRQLGIKSILIIPLVVHGRIVGSLSLDSYQRRVFTPDELELCHVIGNQIAVALDYTHALETAEANRRQAQTLREVSHLLNESLNLDEILPLILEQLQQVLPVDSSSIFLLVEGGVQMKVQRGDYSSFADQEVIPLEALWGATQIVKTKAPKLVSDADQHPQWRTYPGSPIKSWLGVPLTVRGEVVGILNMYGNAPDQFTEAHLDLARAFADQAATAIHNARLYGQAEKRAELLASVQQIGLRLVGSLELPEVLEAITTSVRTLLAASEVRIYLYNPDADTFTLAALPDRAGQITMKISQPRPDGLTATVARTGRYLVVPNALEHPLYYDESHGFEAIIGIPLKKREQVLGVLNVFYEQPHRFTLDEIYVLDLLATQAAVALENARLYEVEVKQLEQELEIARQIQRGFLPQQVPQLPGWRIAAVCLPARETGGDFYEFVERTDGTLGLIVGDVTGKSISAAMLMAAAQSLANAKGSDYASPARVMAETNRLLCEDVPKQTFVALSYALLTPDQGQICLSNGGQLDPFLVPVAGDGPVRLVETSGNRLPLGIFPAVNYQEVPVELAPGDLLVFYTDGLVERKNGAGSLFGFERMAAKLEELRGHSAEAALNALLRAADEFAAGIGPHDDTTLVVVQRLKEG
jgi:sigma-B regulation protein RsbU (phosphoserine phosphatase)